MPSCAIVTCKHRSDTTNLHANGITFHRFPSDPHIKEKWINATAKGPVWWPVKRSTICSVHFKTDDYRPLLKSRRLFDWAVPTLKLPGVITTLSPKHDRDADEISLQSVSSMEPDTGNETSALTCELCEDMELENHLHELPRERKMRIEIEGYKSEIKQKNRKIKTLQTRNSRCRKRISELKAELKKMRDKNENCLKTKK